MVNYGDQNVCLFKYVITLNKNSVKLTNKKSSFVYHLEKFEAQRHHMNYKKYFSTTWNFPINYESLR